jgi:hypothetical protein
VATNEGQTSTNLRSSPGPCSSAVNNSSSESKLGTPFLDARPLHLKPHPQLGAAWGLASLQQAGRCTTSTTSIMYTCAELPAEPAAAA